MMTELPADDIGVGETVRVQVHLREDRVLDFEGTAAVVFVRQPSPEGRESWVAYSGVRDRVPQAVASMLAWTLEGPGLGAGLIGIAGMSGRMDQKFCDDIEKTLEILAGRYHLDPEISERFCNMLIAAGASALAFRSVYLGR